MGFDVSVEKEQGRSVKAREKAKVGIQFSSSLFV